MTPSQESIERARPTVKRWFSGEWLPHKDTMISDLALLLDQVRREEREGQERIEYAAVKHETSGVFQLPRPYRHHHVLHMMAKLSVDHRGAEQGFVTSRGRFVTRRQGWRIAEEAKQFLARAPTGTAGTLFSEDMW